MTRRRARCIPAALLVFLACFSGDDGERAARASKVAEHDYTLPANEDYRQVRNRDRPNRGEINISAFAYRDLNHNGRYDADEQSLFGAKFMLVEAPASDDPKATVATTNRGGFANFAMSASRDDAVIRRPGTYRFVAFPPPGMVVSSGNAVQDFEVRALPGSIGDLVLEAMPKPVGFSPELTVSGQIPRGDEALLLSHGEGDAVPIETDRGGAFSVALEAVGERTIRQSRDELVLERSIPETGAPIVMSILSDLERQARLIREAPERRQVVASFDDLIRTREVRKIPNGYQGLDWDNITAIHNKFSSAVGYHNVVVSGHFSAYNSSGQVGSVRSDEPFDFVGGYFAVAHGRRHGEVLVLEGYADDELVYEDEFPLGAYFPTYFRADYLQITKLVIRTERYWQVAMDDLEFRVSR